MITSEEDRTRLRTVLAEMNAETDELKVALMIFMGAFAGSPVGDALLALALDIAKAAPENPVIQSAAALFSSALSKTKPQ
jgi:hypothetical protein